MNLENAYELSPIRFAGGSYNFEYSLYASIEKAKRYVEVYMVLKSHLFGVIDVTAYCEKSMFEEVLTRPLLEDVANYVAENSISDPDFYYNLRKNNEIYMKLKYNGTLVHSLNTNSQNAGKIRGVNFSERVENDTPLGSLPTEDIHHGKDIAVGEYYVDKKDSDTVIEVQKIEGDLIDYEINEGEGHGQVRLNYFNKLFTRRGNS
jgi:hypothetical protein